MVKAEQKGLTKAEHIPEDAGEPTQVVRDLDGLLRELNSVFSCDLVADNRSTEAALMQGALATSRIFELAEALYQRFCTDHKCEMTFPVPVRKIAKWLKLQVWETEMADLDAMEFDELGAGVKTSQLTLRERRLENGQREVVGTIKVDQNRSEYDKHLAIAGEIGRFVMRTRCPIGPLWTCEESFGQFASYGVDACLASEFAYALLMPYSLVEKEKKQYEKDSRYNPLSYVDWIRHLEDIAQVPMYAVAIAYEEFRKCHLHRRIQG